MLKIWYLLKSIILTGKIKPITLERNPWWYGFLSQAGQRGISCCLTRYALKYLKSYSQSHTKSYLIHCALALSITIYWRLKYQYNQVGLPILIHLKMLLKCLWLWSTDRHIFYFLFLRDHCGIEELVAHNFCSRTFCSWRWPGKDQSLLREACE